MGETPMNNQDQNRQINDAARSLGVQLTRDQRNQVHRQISRTGAGFNDVVNTIREILNIE